MAKCYWYKPVRRVVGQSKPVHERRMKRSNFTATDLKNYGTTYTERQLRILSGDLSWEIVPLHEISLIVNKAKQMNDTETYEKACLLQGLKKNQGAYIPQMTLEEAKEILRSLSPDGK